MNQARFVCLLRYLWIVPLAGSLAPVAADELVRRGGRFIHLTTDLSSAEEAETLVASFDAAVPQWAQFWNLADDALSNWTVDAYVIRNVAEFRRQGLIPAEVPDFPFGYALGNQVFVRAQPSEYYTRHLLLHEGVHSLAYSQFDGAGPTWFREGTAELLSTHIAASAGIRVNQVPASREDFPYWGRFKLMVQLRQQAAVPTLETVMRYKPDLRGDVESYGWSWAAAMMFSRYPEYQETLISAARRGRNEGPGFNRSFKESLKNQWPAVAARWRMMCHDLDYGFDWSRERVALSTEDPQWDGQPLEFDVAADRGWQSIGVRIPGGTKLRLSPSGEITLATTVKPWRSEPPGITFQYHRGRPLGQLLVTALPNASDPQATLLKPLVVQPVEQETTLEIRQFSWLLMRVNDRLGDLSDNTGKYRVRIAVDR